MKISSKSLFVAAFLTAQTQLFSQTTGFNKAAAGPWNYNDTANWIGGTINGIWDSSLTLTANQTATFAADTALGTGLTFSYAGNFNETLQGTGGNRTLTLGGDILVNTTGTTRIITIGSTTAGAALNVDLGGTNRTLSVAGLLGGNRSLTFVNDISNGSLTLNGGGIVNLNGTSNSVTNLSLQNTNLRLGGVSTANSLTTVSGTLFINGDTANGGISSIALTPNAARNTTLTANSLVRQNNGVGFFRGNNLGGTLGANGVSNITFTNAPTAQLIGGGGSAGTKNVSILAWAVGSTTAVGPAETFVTYDTTNGIRALTASEFEVYANGYNGAANGTDLNTRISSSGTVTFTGNNTVNSLFVGDGSTSASTVLNGDGGVLTVTSGAVFFQRATVSQNLNFGSQEGVIGYTQGQNSTFSGGIAGSGGVTFYQPVTSLSSSSAGNGLAVSGSATYTGDTNILGRVQVTNANFLPSGSRSGNVNVEGILEVTTSMSINGLSGSGSVFKTFSGGATLTIGGNDANGNFTGVISNFGTLSIIKTGTGTQVLGGANTYGGATTVSAGTLLVNGSISTGNVSVAAGTLGGAGDGVATGIIGGATTLAPGAKLSPGQSAGLAGNLTFSNGLNLSASSNNTGAYLFDLGAVASSDKITLTSGAVNALNVGTLDATDFTFTTGVGFGAGIYVLFDANSSIAGSIGSGSIDFGGGLTGTLSIDGVNNNVLLTVVPEPSAVLLTCLGLAAILWRPRRMHN